jgi:hypothetical protein
MKKTAFLLLGSLWFSLEVAACDLCSIYLNMEPNDLKNTIGLNYRYRHFENIIHSQRTIESNNKHAAGNTVLQESSLQEEVFINYDLWFNYFLNQKWQINGTLTFADNYYRENDSSLHNIGGIGDLTLLAKYMLYNTKATDSSNWSMRWLVGGGLQLPVGSYRKSYIVAPSQSKNGKAIYGAPYEELDPHMQAGSGSLDYIILTEFQLKYRKTGISVSGIYQINGKNSYGFKFANRFNANTSIFRLIRWNKITLAPGIGLSYEKSKRDLYKGEDYLNSGGSALFSTFFTKIYYSDFALGVNYFQPIEQNLLDNQIPNKERVTVDLSFYF